MTSGLEILQRYAAVKEQLNAERQREGETTCPVCIITLCTFLQQQVLYYCSSELKKRWHARRYMYVYINTCSDGDLDLTCFV